MAGPITDSNAIAFRAPDVYLSGLLSVVLASDNCRTEGDLDTFPAQEGVWYLIGVRECTAMVTCSLGCILLPQDYVLAASGESPVDILCQSSGKLYVLCLKGSLAGSILRESERLGGSIYPDASGVLASGFAQFRQSPLPGAPVSAAEASAVAYQILMRLYGAGSKAARTEKKLPQVVETALKIMQQDFAFLDGIGDLAQRLEVSQEYLTRIFRTHMGMTPGKYLIQVRVEQAKLLLQQGDHSIAFVADACGFTNSNYFARVFRNQVGMTPSVYAREHATRDPMPHPMLDSIYVL